MKKVVTINLNGRAYQLEEDGYAELKKYLDQAAHQLADDPDKDEIIADFEQAIAEKCDQVLTGGKTVVAEAAIKKIITEMGPVNGDETEAAPEDTTQTKRFFLIKEGSMVGGVATGLEAYLNIDVTVIRLVLVLATIFTSGAVVLAYLAIMLVAPVAVTPEEKASARGRRFNSQALLETARQKYAVLGDKEHWKQVANDTQPMLSKAGQSIRRFLRGVSGLIALAGLLALLAILVAGIAGVWSLLISGQIFSISVGPAINTSLLALFIASSLLVAATPIFIITLATFKYAKNGSLRQNIWVLVATLCIFAVALGVSLAILSANPAIRDLKNYTTSDGRTLQQHADDNDTHHDCQRGCPKPIVPPTVQLQTKPISKP